MSFSSLWVESDSSFTIMKLSLSKDLIFYALSFTI